MTEGKDKSNETNNADRKSDALNPGGPRFPIPPENPPAGSAQAQNPDADPDGAKEIGRQLHWLERLNIFGQLSLVAVGIIAASIYGCQLSVMRGTLTEMQRSGAASTQQAWSAVMNINWMARSMDWSQKSTKEAMENQVKKLQIQADKLEASVKQASRLADATEKANANVVDTDRPWIGGSFGVESFAVGKSPTFTLNFINSGKRPARVTLSQTLSVIEDYGNNPVFMSYDTTPSTTLVVPGQSFVSSWKWPAENPFTKEQMRAFDAGTLPYRVYANIEYTDVRTNGQHWTHLCWRYTPNEPAAMTGFSNCTEYNDAE